jgi:hypothetical protein
MSLHMTKRLIAIPLLLCAALPAQVSNGSDGPLNISTSGDFDPVALGKDLDGDNVYHFTTITIASGVTVRLRASKMRNTGPVIWLAQGAVTINGSLILSGDPGHPDSQDLSLRTPSDPGPGGYPGGVGGKPGGVPQRGAGPGGGIVASTNQYGCSAGHTTTGPLPARCTGGGASYGNVLLQPLVGGSGGSGGGPSGNWTGSGGGAGGGAIRIVSPVSITISVNAVVAADGGATGPVSGGFGGGGGSGGSIHLAAPTVSLSNGFCVARGGAVNQVGESGSNGRIRIDGNFVNSGGFVVPSPLVGPYQVSTLPAPNPTVRVTTINSIAVPAFPGNSYIVPDVSINTSSAVPVAIAATNIPLGTVVTLYISTDIGGTDATATTSPLAGTLASSTATANLTLPSGVSRIYVRAVW